jgi:hypothetical protein
LRFHHHAGAGHRGVQQAEGRIREDDRRVGRQGDFLVAPLPLGRQGDQPPALRQVLPRLHRPQFRRHLGVVEEGGRELDGRGHDRAVRESQDQALPARDRHGRRHSGHDRDLVQDRAAVEILHDDHAVRQQ